MAITFITATSTSTGASSSPSCAFGAGYTDPTENDLVLLFFCVATTGITLASTPSGWVNPLGSTVDVESDAHQASVGYHLVTAAEDSGNTTTYTATSWYSSGQTTGIVGCVFRGVDPVNPIDDIVTTFASGNNVTPHVMPALTGSNLDNNSQVVGFVAADTTITYTDPGGDWTLNAKNSGGQQGRASYRRGELTQAGVAVSSQNVTPSAGDEYIGMMIALKDASRSMIASGSRCGQVSSLPNYGALLQF